MVDGNRFDERLGRGKSRCCSLADTDTVMTLIVASRFLTVRDKLNLHHAERSAAAAFPFDKPCALAFCHSSPLSSPHVCIASQPHSPFAACHSATISFTPSSNH
jgi:hypothetical protein